MNTVERIIDLCRKKGITLSRLERECGFGNGYLGKKLKSGTLPADRLEKIAEYLGEDYNYLLHGEWKTWEFNIHDERLLTICEIYDKMNESGRETLLDIATSLFDKDKYKKSIRTGRVIVK